MLGYIKFRISIYQDIIKKEKRQVTYYKNTFTVNKPGGLVPRNYK